MALKTVSLSSPVVGYCTFYRTTASMLLEMSFFTGVNKETMLVLCLYQFRGFGLLAWGNKNLVLARTGGGVYLLGDFSMWGGGDFF